MKRSKHPIKYDNVISQMVSKYNSRLEKYGESWKTCDIDKVLIPNLKKEIEKFEKAGLHIDRQGEAVDIVNIASMILARLVLGTDSKRIWGTKPGRAFRSMG